MCGFSLKLAKAIYIDDIPELYQKYQKPEKSWMKNWNTFEQFDPCDLHLFNFH